MPNKKKTKVKKIKNEFGFNFKNPTAKQLKELDNYTSFGDMLTSTRPIKYKMGGGKIKYKYKGGKIDDANYASCGANIMRTK